MKYAANIIAVLAVIVIVSRDSYSQWSIQKSGTNADLNTIFILDSSRTIAAGDSGVVLRTTDSGVSWIRLNTGIKNNLNDISFFFTYPNTFEGVIAGDSVIATTSDLGDSWHIEKVPYRLISCNYIPPLNHYIIAGDDNGRLFMKPRGAGWVDTLLLPGEQIISLGHDFNTPALSYLNVTGASTFHTFRTLFPNDKWWISENPVSFYDIIRAGDLSNLPQYLAGETGHLVPQPVYWKNNLSDSMWITDYENIEWTRYAGFLPEKFFAIRGIDAYKSFVAVCGTNGTIIRSRDEGKNWIIDTTGTKQTLNSVKFYGESRGFCVGDSGTILYFSGNISGIPDLQMPAGFILHQNYPNPFNPTTKIKYVLPGKGLVTLKVYTLLGAEITTLVNGIQNEGEHEVTFHAGASESGIYFYQIQTGSIIETRKMLLIK